MCEGALLLVFQDFFAVKTFVDSEFWGILQTFDSLLKALLDPLKNECFSVFSLSQG